MAKKKIPIVFLDITFDGGPAERMEIELFADIVPKTAENFRALCTGEKGTGASSQKPLHYKGSVFHRIVKGSIAHGGDFSRGDGSGGESIYGRRFPDENFKLKHEGPGFVSMANTGPDRNGSQFYITLKATPSLDGQNVVFGKVINGSNVLKKLDQAGSETGKPVCLVKVINCGEVSDGKTQAALRPDKDKRMKMNESSVDISGDSSDRGRRIIKGKRKKRKRSFSSTDSYSSDDSDSDSYSSESDSDSESDSSDASSSSDHRHSKRRNLKKDKYRHAKRKKGWIADKRQRGLNKLSKHKSQWSSRNSSDSESEGTGKSSSDSGNSDCQADNNKSKQSLQDAGTSKEVVASLQRPKKDKQISVDDNASHDLDKLFGKNRVPIVDNHLETNVDETVNRHFNSDKRINRGNSKENPSASLRIGLSRELASITQAGGASHSSVRENKTGNHISHSKSPAKSPQHNASEPDINRGRDLSQKTSLNTTGRIRKGRGFTKDYAYVRKYRTPSPERAPVRSSYYTGRNGQERGRNRYSRYRTNTEQSPARKYRGSPRGSSSPRYRSRRGRSRTLSPKPVGHRRKRDGSHSPRHARSPVVDRTHVQSSLGLRVSGRLDGRMRSRSRGRRLSASKSPYTGTQYNARKGNTRYRSSSRSSSPAGFNGLVSYGNGSPEP